MIIINKHLENVLNRYVIATLETPTRYLIFKDNNISFTKHISRATKTGGLNTARSIREEFYAYTKANNIELVILPLRITYELIKDESLINEGDNNGMLS